MAIPSLNLDDRTFGEMMEEVQALIPRCAPAWTNFNLSDPASPSWNSLPGSTEAMLFRINRVPEASRRRFLELLGAVHQTAQPAVLKLRVCAALEAGETIHVPRHTVVQPRLEASKAPLPFETVDEVTFSADLPVRTVVVRQTAPVAGGRRPARQRHAVPAGAAAAADLCTAAAFSHGRLWCWWIGFPGSMSRRCTPPVRTISTLACGRRSTRSYSATASRA